MARASAIARTIELARERVVDDGPLLEKCRARGGDEAWGKEEVKRINALAKYFLAWYLGCIYGIAGFYGFGWSVWGAFFINVGTYFFQTSWLLIDLDEVGEWMEFFIDSFASSYVLFILIWIGVSATLGRTPAVVPAHSIPRGF
jgi:hypothetical protein